MVRRPEVIFLVAGLSSEDVQTRKIISIRFSHLLKFRIGPNDCSLIEALLLSARRFEQAAFFILEIFINAISLGSCFPLLRPHRIRELRRVLPSNLQMLLLLQSHSLLLLLS